MKLDWKAVLSHLFYVFLNWLTSVLTEKLEDIHAKHPDFYAYRRYRKICKKRTKEDK